MASLCYKYQERTWVLHLFIEFLLGLGHGPSFLGELQPPSCNDRSLHCVSTEKRGKYRATYPNGCASVEHAGSKQENKRPTATKEKQIQKTWRNRKRNDAETKGYLSVAYLSTTPSIHHPCGILGEDCASDASTLTGIHRIAGLRVGLGDALFHRDHLVSLEKISTSPISAWKSMSPVPICRTGNRVAARPCSSSGGKCGLRVMRLTLLRSLSLSDLSASTSSRCFAPASSNASNFACRAANFNP